MIMVFDTSILVDLQNGNVSTINKIKKLVKVNPYPAKITVFSKFEFLTGLLEKPSKNELVVKDFISNFNVVNTSDNSSKIFAELKHKYITKGKMLPLIDLLIAGLVIEHNYVLVTKDKDFERIDELKKIIID